MGGPTIRGRSKGQIASITNNTNIYGIMGGSARLIGHKASILHRLQKNTGTPIPTAPGPGLTFMTERGLLSVNPQSSGGTGVNVNMRGRWRW